MKVGLVRHFRVRKPFPSGTLGTQAELMRWFDEFDVADVEYGKVEMAGIQWDSCYSSDLPRAVKTAETIYQGEIIQMEALREVRPYPLFASRDFRLPHADVVRADENRLRGITQIPGGEQSQLRESG